MLAPFRRLCIFSGISLVALFGANAQANEENTVEAKNTTPTAKEYAKCEHNPTDDDVSAAQGAYRAGQVSFEEADYQRALLYWEDAYRRDCTADKLLLNIARAYELSGDNRAALNALQTYVERNPETEPESSVRKRLAKMQEKVEEEDQEKQEQLALAASQQSQDQSSSPEPEPNLQFSPAPRRPLWPVLVTGGGVVFASTGLLLLLRADKVAKDAGCSSNPITGDQFCPTDEASDKASSAAQVANFVGIPLFVVGNLAGAIGGYFWYRTWTSGSPSSKTSHAPVFVPVVSSQFQGFALSGAF